MALSVSPHYLADPMLRGTRSALGLRHRFALATALLLAVACDRAPSAGSAREWTPADHHSQDDDKARGAPAASAAAPKGDETAQLVELAWRQQCSTCHGASGKGDGPMGTMIQAPDLTRSGWQGNTSDADIAAVIQTGRNRMPKFDLPDVVVRGLVARIRSLKGS
jgi:cytochrome c oxidase cbb3-type subunit 3